LDSIDRRLLDLLRQHARMTNRDLAKHLNLSESACSARLRRLEQDGVIIGYTAILSPILTGHAVRAMVEMQLSDSGDSTRDAFEGLLRGANSVMGAFQTTKANAYLVKFGAPDVAGVHTVLDRMSHNGIACAPTQSWLIARRVKPLPPASSE
jgi:Lrp/AsnC family leucine-responsive transcriptional regulator